MTPKWIDPKKRMPLPDSKVRMLIHFDGYPSPEYEQINPSPRDEIETGYWAQKLWMDDETVPVEDDENKVIKWMYL